MTANSEVERLIGELWWQRRNTGSVDTHEFNFFFNLTFLSRERKILYSSVGKLSHERKSLHSSFEKFCHMNENLYSSCCKRYVVPGRWIIMCSNYCKNVPFIILASTPTMSQWFFICLYNSFLGAWLICTINRLSSYLFKRLVSRHVGYSYINK